MQDRRNTGQEGCKTGRMHDRTDEGHDEYRAVWVQDRRSTVQEGCRT